MINQISFSQHSNELALDKSTQRFLMLADMSRYMSGVGKFGSIAGAVSAVAGTILGYNPRPLLKITAASAITWFSCHQIYQTLEPQALSIIGKSRHAMSPSSSDKPLETFNDWFNEELLVLRKALSNEKGYWIVLDSKILAEKYCLTLKREEIPNYLDSVATNKEIQFSLIHGTGGAVGLSGFPFLLSSP